MKIIHLAEPQNGWIKVTLGLPPDTHTMMASHVPNDCLRDLAAATARLLQGTSEEIVEFSLEPDFATWRISRADEAIHLAVCEPRQTSPVFEVIFPLRSFAARLRFEMLRIEPRYAGPEGWAHSFPHREVANLALTHGSFT